MSSRKKALSIDNLPTRLPITTTAVVYLLLDKFQAEPTVWGIVGTIFVMMWIGAFMLIWKEDEVEIFKDSSK